MNKVLAGGQCIHLLQFESCAVCNGVLDKKESEKRNHTDAKIKRDELRARHLYMQESSKFFAHNHDKPYSDEELKYIITNTEDTTRQDTVVFFNIAREVGRRLGSIEWLWNYIWREGFENVLKDGEGNKLYERIQNLKALVI